MKIGEMISKLIEVKKENGDIDVVLYDHQLPEIPGSSLVNLDDDLFEIVEDDYGNDVLLID